MSVRFRSMKAGDKEAVVDMMKTFYNSPAVYTSGSEEIFLNDINNCINDNPYLEGYIFEDGEEICGYSMIAKSFSMEFGKRCIWIEDIFIKEKYRGKGIGKRFFDFLERKYKDVIFRLEAEKENTAAIHLYEKEGYNILPYIEMKK